MPVTTVGFIGLGDQGAPIAQRILAAGWPLRVWARRSASVAPLVAAGAVVAGSPAELGAACDLVGVCVSTDDDVREVVLRDGDGVLSGMAKGGVIAVHSTVSPDTVRELHREARQRDVALLDAPVSGGSGGARAGTLTVMVGGDAEPVTVARPVFDTFAGTVAHLGPVGAGQEMKLLNNNLCYANVAMGVSAMEIAERLGMDLAEVAAIIKRSSGASTGFSIVTEQALLQKASGPTSNIRKDVGHFHEILKRHGLDDEPLAAVAATTAGRVSAYAEHVSR
ncbi:MAG TPA: NAD(P)-dependent oxidoreductase [Amycolatopsis sp.]|nr:NAD(P)-dependent oxidoreductase [Amycolatopsis sp.]